MQAIWMNNPNTPGMEEIKFSQSSNFYKGHHTVLQT